jgi:hypothetical protein
MRLEGGSGEEVSENEGGSDQYREDNEGELVTAGGVDDLAHGFGVRSGLRQV